MKELKLFRRGTATTLLMHDEEKWLMRHEYLS
jgi:hypothetical protein